MAVATAAVLVGPAVAPAEAQTPAPSVPVAPPAKPAPPVTATKPVSAKARLLEADRKQKAGDYAGALEDYQAADTEKPSAESARGIAVCQEKLGNAAEAVAAYQRFLEAKPPGKKADLEAAQASITALQKMPGKLHVDSSPPHAQVTVDGAAQPGPTPLDVELPAGTHVVHVSSEGKAAVDRTVTMTFGQKQELVVELEPLPAAPPPPPPAQPPLPQSPPPPALAPADNVMHRSPLPAYITGGLAIAAAGVGTVFGAIALSDKSNFDKHPTSDGADTGENHALVSDMAFGVAITLAVTSAVLYFTRDEAVTPSTSKYEPARAKKADQPSIGLAPILSPHGGGAGALIQF
jgi:hypothetical protein